MTKIIIGLTGRAGAGKDTAAEFLVNRCDFKQYAFAWPLKNAAREIFGFSHEQLHGNLKEEVDPYWCATPRTVLQVMGTEAMRDTFGPDIWIRAAQRWIERIEASVVISDVRFENEAEFIRRIGGKLIHIARPTPSVLSESSQMHLSEVGIKFADGDCIVMNDGTVENLDARIYQHVRESLDV